jgi:hypothetical protein
MLNHSHNSKRIRFGGLIWLWAIPSKLNESSRQGFFRTYESLRNAVEQKTSPQSPKPWWEWKIVRIQEAGRWFLGIARH